MCISSRCTSWSGNLRGETKETYSEMGNQMEDQEGDDYVPNEPQATDTRREELASSESYANVKPVKGDSDERYRFEADDWGDHW